MAWDLKNEEDVKEYLENLGTEYRFGCLSEKKPDGITVHVVHIKDFHYISHFLWQNLVCHLLGDFMESIKKDFPKAASLYRSNCDDYKYSRSCHKFAAYSLVGKGCQEDYLRAFDYFKKGCELGEADSCLYSGLMYITKTKKNLIEQNFPAGMELLNQACDKGSHNGCFYLAGLHISGVTNVVQQDMSTAFKYSVKACDLGNMYACGNVGRMYFKGEGVEENKELAEKYKKKAMDLESELQAKFKPIELQRGSSPA